MKTIVLAVMATVMVAGCGKEEPKVDKNATFIQPYTEHIPLPSEGKKNERYFDIKPAKPTEHQK